MELEKQLADMSGKNEALDQLLKQERENIKLYLADTKERYQEKKMELEQKIGESNETWESKLKDAERWKRKLEDENEDLRSEVKILKISLKSGGKQSEQLSQELTRELSKLDSNVGKDVSRISENLESFMTEMKGMQQEKFDLRLKYEMEKELAQMEKRHFQQLNDAKNLSTSVMEKLRESYDDEIKDLQDYIKGLERAKEVNLIKLVEKEGYVRLFVIM